MARKHHSRIAKPHPYNSASLPASGCWDFHYVHLNSLAWSVYAQSAFRISAADGHCLPAMKHAAARAIPESIQPCMDDDIATKCSGTGCSKGMPPDHMQPPLGISGQKHRNINTSGVKEIKTCRQENGNRILISDALIRLQMNDDFRKKLPHHGVCPYIQALSQYHMKISLSLSDK